MVGIGTDMTASSKSPTYVRLLNTLIALREITPFSELTADEERLLEDLAVRWYHAGKVTVGDIMGETERSSPSTIYRRLIGLRDKGVIAMPADENDKRVKLVVPTSTAQEYVRILSDGLHKLIDTEKLA